MRWAIGVLVGIMVVCVSWNIYLYFGNSNTTTANYLFNLAYGASFGWGAVVAGWGIRIHSLKSVLGKSLAFLGSASFVYALGQIVWTYYNLALHTPIPYPGPADILWLIYYLLVLVGTGYLFSYFEIKITFQTIVEIALIFGAVFTVIYAILHQANSSQEINIISKTLNLVYPSLDALMVSLAIILIRSAKGILMPKLHFFSYAFLAMALGDTLFSYRSTLGTYWNGGISDTLLMLSGFLMAFGIIFLSQLPGNKPGDQVSR